MSLTDKDKQIWQAYTKGVTPLGKPPQIAPVQTAAPVRVATHRVAPFMDLHGETLQSAWQSVRHHVEHLKHEVKHMTVVTGKSGQIRQEFPSWLVTMPGVQKVESINGGGAFRVHFKKTRHNKK